MQDMSTLCEGKCEDSSLLSQCSSAKICDSKDKTKIKAIKKSCKILSGIRPHSDFQIHSIIKPKEQKITSIFIKSKYWKRKKFLAVSPNLSEIQVNDRLVIFNNEQIETCYSDQQPERIFSLSKDINRVVSVNKNKVDRVIEMNLSSPYENKQHTFKFLIDHFRKVPDPLYQNLHKELRKYQTHVSAMYNRLHSISKQMSQQQDYHSEVVQVSSLILNQIKSKVSQWCSQNKENCFYMYKIQKVNYESKTYELVSQGLNFNLMNLIGQDEERSESNPLCSYNNLLSITKQYDGQQRIITQTRLIEAMNQYSNEVKDIKIILQTLDFIDISTTADVSFIYPTLVPIWMGKQDINAQIWCFKINQNQIDQVNQLRSSNSYSEQAFTSDNIHDQISREIFFSKFYPNQQN